MAASTAAPHLEELTAATRGWRLEHDIQLLAYLEDFSGRLFQRVQDTRAQVDELALDCSSADLDLQTTFNRLLTMSHTQFVENRIDELDDDGEDDTDASGDDRQEPTAADGPSLEVRVQQKYTQAVALARQALRHSRLPLDLPHDDAED
eukprot:EG_transcript_41917